MSTFSFDTTVLGGLPVEITCTIEESDPSVGIFESYVDEWYISGVGGKTQKNTQWIEKRLTDSDRETIEEECYENQ